MSEVLATRRDRGGVRLGDHLEAVRLQELKDVYAFWSGGEPPELPKREITRQLAEVMSDEGTVYRRVRTLTRKVLDVLLLLLRRADYRSDLPGLFRRMPGEEQVALEYHEAEAALRALVRRGFVGEWADRSASLQGRSTFAVPLELGDILASLFREETRTVRSVFGLEGFCASLGATDRRALAARFPGLAHDPGPDDVAAVLGEGGGPARLEAVEPAALRDLVRRAAAEGGLLLRSDVAGRDAKGAPAWDRRAYSRALESAGVGTVARLALGEYGIACDDEAIVVFHEVLEDLLRRAAPAEPDADEVLKPGGDLVSDLQAFLGEVRRQPIRLTREGEVHKAAQKRLQDGFVFRETSLAGAPEVFAEIRAAADHLGLVAADREGFLACRDEAERWSALPLDAKVSGLYRLALEAPGPRGRSLHLCEMRRIVGDLLKEEPDRWWPGDSLFVVARQRYLASLDARKIRDRHRDRHFGAYVSAREAPRDLLADLARSWRRTLFLFGMVDVAAKADRPVALRLSSLGARVLGVAASGRMGPAKALLVSPDFEVIVLPEGDVADAVHYLGGFAQRVKNGEVVHFRFTKDTIESATAQGRRVGDLLAWLGERARGPIPQNVAVSLTAWASAVTFATLERGVVFRLEKPAVLDAVLEIPGMKALLVRRLSPTEVLLKDEPKDRRLLAALRADAVYLEGP